VKRYRKCTVYPFFIVLFLFAPLAGIASLFAQDVHLVQSYDIVSYRKVVAGFKNVYTKPFDTYDLKGSPAEFYKVKQHFSENDIVVTVGLVATTLVRDEMGKGLLGGQIFCMLFNPARFSLPDKMITGVSLEVSPIEVFSKIKQTFPHAKKIGILYDPQKSKNIIEANEQAAKTVGLSLILAPVLSEKTLPQAVRGLFGQIDLLWLIPDSTVLTPQSVEFIFLSSFAYRLPVVTVSEDLVKMGAVMSIAPDFKAIGAAVGHVTNRILNGADPGEIPLQYAGKIRLTLNKKTAQKIGIEIPEAILKQAERVYD
jgi:putative ABC transport system substrate-binding protein